MNYYNEHDPKATAWLRELITQGLIPPGHVDTRSISEIQPHELADYNQCHFFAGIGGWSLALQLAGWPTDRPVWTGSCPCQPFSVAGKGLGEADERHLWPVFHWLIAQCRPPVVFGEQVASKDALRWLDGVFADMEGENYACGAADLCAAGVGAPHIRQRLYWVAIATGKREHGGCGDTASTGAAGNESEQEPDKHCAAGGLAFAEHAERRAERQEQREAHGRNGLGGSSESGGVEHAQSHGWEPWRAEPSGGSTPSGCGIGRIGDTLQPGLEGQPRNGDHRDQPGRLDESPAGPAPAPSGASHWRDFDLLPCLDGKTRRVESGTFPLAHGIPGRVGLLRGYGNAIVPQVAAQFIQACEEVIA